jgi:diacylglycerol kinase (ATP)
MRAAAILRPGDVSKWVAKFQRIAGVEWSSELSPSTDAAVIFGGDGTVHRHLPTMVELQLPVLVVPCGSGNDFARALNLRSVDDSLNAWRAFVTGRHNVCDIDLGVIQEVKPDETPGPHVEYFCCVAGVGIDTEIVRRANGLPKWIRSHGGYALSAPREFLRFSPFPMKISCHDATSSTFQPTILAAFANAPTYGGGMKIAPQAKLDDGKLDVCIVRAMDRSKLFCLFPTVYFGRHLCFDEVEYAQAVRAKLETEYPLDVYADGEYVCQTPVEFAVARGALKVIIPE